MPPGKVLIQCFILSLTMHPQISCMPLAVRIKNSAASVFYKRHPSTWLRRHSHVSSLSHAVTILATVDLFKSDFFRSNARLLEKRDNF